jgi:hypothetical protein
MLRIPKDSRGQDNLSLPAQRESSPYGAAFESETCIPPRRAKPLTANNPD